LQVAQLSNCMPPPTAHRGLRENKTRWKFSLPGVCEHWLACTRFRRHRERCFHGTGGASWRGGSAFERLCQRVLRESGFVKVEVSGRSGDGGIDGTGVLRLNLLSFQVLFQSKRYRGSVGSSVVRDFRGAMVGRADKGLIITTGTFTAEARREATRDGAPAIDLVDGEALCDLLKSLRIGVKVETVESVTVDQVSLSSL